VCWASTSGSAASRTTPIPLVIFAAILGIVGVPLGEWFRRHAQRFLRLVTRLLVNSAVEDDQDRAALSKMEREAVNELRSALADVRQAAERAERDGKPERLWQARERWQQRKGPAAYRLSRS
jgi:hypothetical protein